MEDTHISMFYGNNMDTLLFYWRRWKLRREKRVIEYTPKNGAFHFDDVWGFRGFLAPFRNRFPEGTIVHERFAYSDSTFSHVMVEFRDETDLVLFKIAQ